MSLDLLLAAMIQVESGGALMAYNRRTGAAGPLQIKPCVVTEVNRIYGTDYSMADRFTMEGSTSIWRLHSQAKCGPEMNPEMVARTWKEGTGGRHNERAYRYWMKVRVEMRSLARRQTGGGR